MRKFLLVLMLAAVLLPVVLSVSSCGETTAQGTVWYSGTGAPCADTHAGKVGDFYLSDDGKVYQMTADGWVYFADLAGTDGADGIDGADGKNGVAGAAGKDGQTPTVSISTPCMVSINTMTHFRLHLSMRLPQKGERNIVTNIEIEDISPISALDPVV